jgi:glutathione S-transferase
MSDYDLYYWSVPFRGQFVRAVLAYAGRTWTEGGDTAISRLMDGPVKYMLNSGGAVCFSCRAES